jgi:hypothetical protein
VRELGESRFELLQRLEIAPESAPDVEWMMLDARQHELEHLAAMWRAALYWDRVSLTAVPGAAGYPLHPADRLEESH